MSAPRSEPTSGTLVIRERRVAYASAGAGAVLGRPGRDILGRPLAEFLAPEERERVAGRLDRLLRGEPVPDEYEVALCLPDGARRTVEARAALEGHDEVVLQLRDVSDQAPRRRRLASLAELGVAIQRERTEAAIFERVCAGLRELGLAAVMMRPEGETVRVAWASLPVEVEAAFAARLGHGAGGLLVPWNDFNRAAWEEGVAYSDDWATQVVAFLPGEFHAEVRAMAAATGLVRALAVRLDERRGATRYLVTAGEWLRPVDVPALRLFGAQVTAALDSAEAIEALSARNYDLAALNRLGELSGGTLALAEFLPRAGEVVRSTAGCDAVAIYGVDHAAGALRLAFEAGAPPALREGSALVGLDTDLGRVVTARRLQVAQVADIRPAHRGWLEVAGFQTFCYVPLVARSRALGVMVTGWRARRDEAACRPDLLLAMGAHFAAALEAADLLSDLRRRVAELTLLNDVATATASLDPVLLLENALARIGETLEAEGGLAYVVEGGALLQQATLGLSPESEAQVARLELGEGPAGLALEKLVAVTEVTEAQLGPRCGAVRAREGFQALVAVPLLAKTRAVGALCLARRAPRPFGPGEVALLTSIGVQLGVAVEAARTHADTRRRARDLEAVNALALKAFGDAPGDTRVLVADAAAQACWALEARQVVIMLLDDTGEVLHPAAVHGDPLPPGLGALPVAASALAGDALRTGLPSYAEDTSADPRSYTAGRPGIPAVALLVVPLAARGRNRGIISFTRPLGQRFGEADLGLATALGSELALALENAELHAGARRNLAELSAIIETARVVSSELDRDRVLDLGAEHLRQTVGGEGCTILSVDRRAGQLRRVAHRGPPLERPALPLDAPTLAAEALASGAPVSGALPSAVPGGGRPVLAVPLLAREQQLGVALVSLPGPARRPAEGGLARAVAIANQLAVALDNARLVAELRRRHDELTMLQEVGKSLVATLELGQVLDDGVKTLARIVDAPEAYLSLLEDDGAALEMKAVAGPRRELVGRRLPATAQASLAGLVLERREIVTVEDADADPRVGPAMRQLARARAYLGLPLLVKDRPIGAAVIVETTGPRRFTREEQARAGAIANQLAVAVDNARNHADALARLAALRDAQARLLQKERLAALGELSAVVAHEVRNPLGVIFNSLGSIRRLLRPEGDAKLLLDIVGEEADRLNRIVGDLLDFARPAAPTIRPERLERVVEEAVGVAVGQAGGAVEVARDVDPALPEVPVDAGQVRQAVLNVAVNAVQAMPRGGRLAVRVRAEGRYAVVELEDGGPGIPPDVRSRIFEPFFTTKATGTGLGLAVVRRIMDGHGGEVGVRGGATTGTVFSLRFPLAGPTAAVESRPGMR